MKLYLTVKLFIYGYIMAIIFLIMFQALKTFKNKFFYGPISINMLDFYFCYFIDLQYT